MKQNEETTAQRIILGISWQFMAIATFISAAMVQLMKHIPYRSYKSTTVEIFNNEHTTCMIEYFTYTREMIGRVKGNVALMDVVKLCWNKHTDIPDTDRVYEKIKDKNE